MRNAQAMQNAQADANLVNTVGQSVNNYLYEQQTNAYENRQKAMTYALSLATRPAEQAYSSGYQSALEQLYGAEYNNAADKAQYSSIESWAQAHYPSDFNNPNSSIMRRKQQLEDAYITATVQAQRELGLNDSKDPFRRSSQALLTGNNLKRFGAPEYAKKGGRLNGHTRYTLEPDERI